MIVIALCVVDYYIYESLAADCKEVSYLFFLLLDLLGTGDTVVLTGGSVTTFTWLPFLMPVLDPDEK